MKLVTYYERPRSNWTKTYCLFSLQNRHIFFAFFSGTGVSTSAKNFPFAILPSRVTRARLAFVSVRLLHVEIYAGSAGYPRCWRTH